MQSIGEIDAKIADYPSLLSAQTIVDRPYNSYPLSDLPALVSAYHITARYLRLQSLVSVSTLEINKWKGEILPSLKSVDLIVRSCRLMDCAEIRAPLLERGGCTNCKHIKYGKPQSKISGGCMFFALFFVVAGGMFSVASIYGIMYISAVFVILLGVPLSMLGMGIYWIYQSCE